MQKENNYKLHVNQINAAIKTWTVVMYVPMFAG